MGVKHVIINTSKFILNNPRSDNNNIFCDVDLGRQITNSELLNISNKDVLEKNSLKI